MWKSFIGIFFLFKILDILVCFHAFLCDSPALILSDLDSLFNTSTQWCNEGCNLLWDGFGRWINRYWVPYKTGKSRNCFILNFQPKIYGFLTIFLQWYKKNWESDVLKLRFPQYITVPRGQATGRGLVSYGYMATRIIDGSTNLFTEDSCVLAFSALVITQMSGSTG